MEYWSHYLSERKLMMLYLRDYLMKFLLKQECQFVYSFEYQSGSLYRFVYSFELKTEFGF